MSSILIFSYVLTGGHVVIGVDLGTTYSVVAISQYNNVTVIPDQFGQLLTPSMVALVDNGGVRN